MSYDLAVWAGPAPGDAAAAGAEFTRRYGARIPGTPVAPAIAALVVALTDRFRDLTDLADDEIDVVDTPWADGPLISNASGDFFYFSMTFSGAEAHLEAVVGIVRAHNLVCFDPQTGSVRCAPEPAAGRPATGGPPLRRGIFGRRR